MNWEWTAFLCFCAVLAFFLSRHTFWRDEVQAWQIAIHSESIPSLFHTLRYEGHPALWYLLLRAFGVLSDSPGMMLARTGSWRA